MSRELQERAERITQELKEALIPLRDEINRLRDANIYKEIKLSNHP